MTFQNKSVAGFRVLEAHETKLIGGGLGDPSDVPEGYVIAEGSNNMYMYEVDASGEQTGVIEFSPHGLERFNTDPDTNWPGVIADLGLIIFGSLGGLTIGSSVLAALSLVGGAAAAALDELVGGGIGDDDSDDDGDDDDDDDDGYYNDDENDYDDDDDDDDNEGSVTIGEEEEDEEEEL